jgi:ribosomal protein S18 acetylase RimI-like enzyme
MLRIEKVNENNKQRVIDSLQLDIIRHVFAFYDIQHEPEHTKMYAAFENRSLKGYVLTYTALDFPSVILECESNIAEKLIDHAPENRLIMHAPPNLLPIVKRKFPCAKCYVEDWMLVKKGEAYFFTSQLVRRLFTEDDASKLAVLLSLQKNRPRGKQEKYVDLIGRQPIYGVFANGKLVSYAGSFIQLPQVWMIGGVYTHPKHRSKGYATLATSAVTEEALKNAEAAALFVRSDNYSAIKVYKKIGYKKIGEKLWIDAGTGMRP